MVGQRMALVLVRMVEQRMAWVEVVVVHNKLVHKMVGKRA